MLHKMRTIAISDTGVCLQSVSLSVCMSGWDVQKRLNGSTSNWSKDYRRHKKHCVGWESSSPAMEIERGFNAAFAKLLCPLVLADDHPG